jgi:glycosyltransferase involved in cell wall biosynthesis
MNKPKIDIVIPTKNEWTLPYCIQSVRRNIPVNQLILVAPSDFISSLKPLADVLIAFDEKNVGKARAKGLENVETEYYASVDSDMLINPHWYDWCVKTIQPEKVGACQGIGKPLAPLYWEFEKGYLKRGGMYGKVFCCLGNTMLKTFLVRKVGMPQVRVGEDWALRLRVEKAGYKWVSNINLPCTHLKNDVDIWEHPLWWGEMGGDVNVKGSIHNMGWFCTKGLMKYKFKVNLYGIALQLFTLYGYFRKKLV